MNFPGLDRSPQQADMSYSLQVVGDHSQGLSVHDLPTHYKVGCAPTTLWYYLIHVSNISFYSA